MAGLTVTTLPNNRSEDVWGRRRIRLLRVTFDSSYPTGGEAFDLLTYGIADPTNAIVIAVQRPLTTAGVVNSVNYDPTAKKLVVTVDASGSEAASTTSCDKLTVDLVIIEV